MFNRMGNSSKTFCVRKRLLPYCVPGNRAADGNLISFSSSGLWEGWACEHGLMSILYCNLKDTEIWEELPEDLKQRMVHYYFDCHFQQQRAEHALAAIHGAFDADGIEYLLIKGPAVSHLYYPDPAMRPSRDLDLLVTEKDRLRAMDVLSTLPYQMDRSEEDYAANSAMCQRLFLSRSEMLPPVELHWGFVNSLSLKKNLAYRDEYIFRRAEICEVAGVQVRCLANKDLLAYLCIHAAYHHQLDKLIWLVDLIQIIRKNKVEITAQGDFDMAEDMDTPGARLAVFTCLQKVHLLFPGELNGLGVPLHFPLLSRVLLSALNKRSMLLTETGEAKLRRKLFREGLKKHV